MLTIKKVNYTSIKGWFDLSKLDLPTAKFNKYAKLQEIGQRYQKTYAYQNKYNKMQLEKVKELCAAMQADLIKNYGA